MRPHTETTNSGFKSVSHTGSTLDANPGFRIFTDVKLHSHAQSLLSSRVCCAVTCVRPLQVAVCVLAVRVAPSTGAQYLYFKPRMSRSKCKSSSIEMTVVAGYLG